LNLLNSIVGYKARYSVGWEYFFSDSVLHCPAHVNEGRIIQLTSFDLM